MKSTYAVMLGLALVCAGCSGGGKDQTEGVKQGAKTGKLKIAVIPKGTTHEFWKAVHAGAADAARELGVEIVWKGPLVESDKNKQVEVVEDFITQKVDGIVLAPLDDMALRVPVSNAKKSGIPVVIIDSGLNSEDYASFVATDNEKGGELAAQRMIELLGGKGKIVMMRYQAGSASTQLREEGFLKGIGKAPGIQVVSDNQYGDATTATAQTTGENILNPLRKPDGSLGIDGIFCPNESTTFGMLRVLQENKWAGKVKFVGFDSSEKLVEALTAGQIHGLVLQDPYKMGKLGVETMVKAIRGKPFDKRVDTGVTIVTKENMGQKEMQALLKPKQF